MFNPVSIAHYSSSIHLINDCVFFIPYGMTYVERFSSDPLKPELKQSQHPIKTRKTSRGANEHSE